MTNTTRTIATRPSMGVSTILTLIFVVLKLVGVIHWSWWWVLAPTLITVGLSIGAIIIFGIVFGIVALIVHSSDKKTRKAAELRRTTIAAHLNPVNWKASK
jgi:hypothetical protein